MKRFFLCWALGTALALGLVHQKVDLIRLGYEVEGLGHARDDLLDQHRVLQYNVLTLQSPVILQERLAQRDVLLAPPRTVEIVPALTPAGPPGRSAKFLSRDVPQSGASAEGMTALEPSVWERALRFAMSWFGGGPQAVAEPVRE